MRSEDDTRYPFADWLRQQIAARGMKVADLARAIAGAGNGHEASARGAIYRWLRGADYPGGRYREKLAEIFGVTKLPAFRNTPAPATRKPLNQAIDPWLEHWLAGFWLFSAEDRNWLLAQIALGKSLIDKG